MECLELNYQRLKNLNKDSAEEIIQKIMSKVLEDYTTLENKDFQGKLINSNNTNYGIEIIKHNRWEGEEYSDEKTKTEIGLLCAYDSNGEKIAEYDMAVVLNVRRKNRSFFSYYYCDNVDVKKVIEKVIPKHTVVTLE